MQDAGVLGGLGLTPHEELVYESLVARAGVPVATIVASAGLGRMRVQVAIQGLEAMGLVTRDAGKPARYSVVPPQQAIEVLILHRMEEIERARVHSLRLQERYRHAHHDETAGQLIEIVGHRAGADRYLQLLRAATDVVAVGDALADLSLTRVLKRGVRYRGIYPRSAFELPDSMQRLDGWIRAGEEVRSLPDIVVQFIVFDRASAFLPLVADDLRAGFIVMKTKGVVDALHQLFEMLWQRATPLGTDVSVQPQSDISERDRRIVTLLASGLKREAVARQLGVSPSTVDRLIKRLMRELGASSHLQVGVLMAKKGWL